MITKSNDLIAIVGATAAGKTSVAVALACEIGGEIISADSRQVYKGMDLGTGKDIEEYKVKGVQVPYHLIDVVDPGEKYNVFEYQTDFFNAYKDITDRGKPVVLCGGTGMYIEAVTKDYKLLKVPVNEVLRNDLNDLSDEELMKRLKALKQVHNTSDFDTRKRMIRAIEIAAYEQLHPIEENIYPNLNTIYFGIRFDREERRKRITERLKARLNEGMIQEVEALLEKGVSSNDLIYYGLEYKYLTLYVLGDLSYNDMFQKLNSAIHQFSKRQMTWFRRMEKQGTVINWVDGFLPLEEKVNKIKRYLNRTI